MLSEIFLLFGRAGFHVCAEQYLEVLTCFPLFTIEQSAAGNWWGLLLQQTGRNLFWIELQNQHLLSSLCYKRKTISWRHQLPHWSLFLHKNDQVVLSGGCLLSRLAYIPIDLSAPVLPAVIRNQLFPDIVQFLMHKQAYTWLWYRLCLCCIFSGYSCSSYGGSIFWEPVSRSWSAIVV